VTGGGSLGGKVGGPPSRSSAAAVAAAPRPRTSGGSSIASRLQQPLGASGGYPRGAQARVTVQDMRSQLEQMKRETREMKAMESQMHAKMRREEEKQKKVERERDRKSHLEHKKAESDSMRGVIEERRRQEKAVDLAASREYQETKRSLKEVNREMELHERREAYEDSKEHSLYRAEFHKMDLKERHRAPIEENLERHEVNAQYKLEEQQREEHERREARLAHEHSELQVQMEKARRERDLALQSVEFLRGSHQAPVPEDHHLAARPK